MYLLVVTVILVILLREQMLSMSSFQPRQEAWWLILLVSSALSCAGRADLVPGHGEIPLDCPTDADQRLLITVSNEGNRPAIATTTVLQYDDRPPVLVPTRPIAPAQSETLTVRLPDECLWSACSFQIQVDSREEVIEKDENNNRVQGECVRVGRKHAIRP